VSADDFFGPIGGCTAVLPPAGASRLDELTGAVAAIEDLELQRALVSMARPMVAAVARKRGR
jgi:L-aminopeptidase/D-esterase-like protein